MPHLTDARRIFVLSADTFQSRALRAVEKAFALSSKFLQLQLQIERRHQRKPAMLVTSMEVGKGKYKRNLVDAKITLNGPMNKHAQRFHIAHELYHLLLELEAYEKSNEWVQLDMDTQMEASCNKFAQLLCFYQQEGFYRTTDTRFNTLRYPPSLFETELNAAVDLSLLAGFEVTAAPIPHIDPADIPIPWDTSVA